VTAPAVEIVAAGDSALSSAMVEATAEGLPANSRVQTVERATSNADVVVTLRWATDSDRRATLHVRVRDGRESERVVVFAASDPDRERGRTLGFAVAAMIPDDVRGPDDAPPPPPPAPPPREEAKADVRAEEPRRTEQPPPRSKASVDDGKVWVDVTAQGATGFAGSASSLGGGLAFRVPLRPIVLRLAGAVRGGEIPEADDATCTTIRGDAGAGLYTLVLDRKVMLGGRTGLAVFRHSLTRGERTGAQVSGTHTLLGMEAMLEAGVALSPNVLVIAAAGTEVAFGTTRVLVGPSEVTVIPAVRPTAELGFRAVF
jgi:hypothetical protein